MQENVFSFVYGDIRLSVVVFEDAFRLRGKGMSSHGVIEQWRSIHQHSTYEFFFVTEGTLSVMTGERTVEGTSSVVIVPPRFNHYAVLSEELLGYCVYVTLQRVTGERGMAYDLLTARLSRDVTVLPLSEDEEFYLERSERALEEGRRGQNRLSHLFPLLFESLIQRLIPEQPDGSSQEEKHQRYVHSLDAYLARHYCESIHLSQLAAELYLCPKQVSRIIRREYGCSLAELVNRRRLAAACILLRYTDTDIGEIARRVGYEYENYFYTAFRKYYGVTPLQYRRASSGEQAQTQKG